MAKASESTNANYKATRSVGRGRCTNERLTAIGRVFVNTQNLNYVRELNQPELIKLGGTSVGDNCIPRKGPGTVGPTWLETVSKRFKNVK